jgi:hypothetical protein
MSKARFVIAAVALGSALGIASCADPPADAPVAADAPAAAALRDTGAVESLAETRWGSKAAAGTSAPSFVVDVS